MTISESHRQMLRTMLQYELDNYVKPQIMQIKERKIARDDEVCLFTAKQYLESRIEALAE